MYTGAQPSVHGIQKYEKPVITIDTIFDALIRAGKRPVILAYAVCSLSKIYLNRDMDYYIFDTLDEVNAKAAELILKDEHDFYVVYNGNYDTKMHKNGPESIVALSELRANSRTYAMFNEMIKEHWTSHNTLVGFAMDHGCHEIDGQSGSHGLDMPEDLNIVHFYKAYEAKK
jgi:predicted AlkP superfamily pyrophosphatase or phosphodiesterase